MSRVPLSPLLAVAGVGVGLSLACGPLGGDDLPTEGGSKRVGPTTSHRTGSSSQGSGGAASSGAAHSSDVDCDADLTVPKARGCAIARIACGESIEGSNHGQAGHFGDDFYRSKFCTPRAASYADGPEAVYALTVPANMQADITLDSPCDDLDLFSVRWSSADRCPSVSTSTGECEGSTKGAVDTVRIVSVGRDEEHLVWVDGKKGAEGNFALRVDCRPAR